MDVSTPRHSSPHPSCTVNPEQLIGSRIIGKKKGKDEGVLGGNG